MQNIDCDYETKDNFVYSTDDRRCIESEVTALDKIGYEAELCYSLPLPINIAGAVCFRNQAQFHPLKFYLISQGSLISVKTPCQRNDRQYRNYKQRQDKS